MEAFLILSLEINFEDCKFLWLQNKVCEIITFHPIFCQLPICVAVETRGRKKNSIWPCHVLLLSKHNEDFVPSLSEQTRLTRNGLGMFPVPEVLYTFYSGIHQITLGLALLSANQVSSLIAHLHFTRINSRWVMSLGWSENYVKVRVCACIFLRASEYQVFTVWARDVKFHYRGGIARCGW